MGTSSDTSRLRTEQQLYQRARFSHAVNVEDVFRLARKHDLRLVAIGFHQEMAGQMRVDAGVDYQERIRVLLDTFRELYGTQPRVVDATLLTKSMATTGERIKRFVGDLEDAPTFQPQPADTERIERRLARVDSSVNSGTVPAATLDSPWAPQGVSGYALEAPADKVYDRYISWSLHWTGSPDHDVRLFPDDWGMEVEFDLFLPSEYECADPRDPQWFWATYLLSYSLYPAEGADYGHYWDENALDECERNIFTIGIGYPPNIPDSAPEPQTGYHLGAEIFAQGPTDDPPWPSNDSSVVQFNLDSVSNDCNDLGQRPGGWCMGINDQRIWPGPGDGNEFGLNKSRGCETQMDFFLTAGNSPVYNCGY